VIAAFLLPSVSKISDFWVLSFPLFALLRINGESRASPQRERCHLSRDRLTLSKANLKGFHVKRQEEVMSWVDLPTVKEILGHREIEMMTLRYSHLAPGSREAWQS
jgi:hypothetical protein